jgi:diadenosine tetraphosphate (Ap4A) HIT family hydrolase
MDTLPADPFALLTGLGPTPTQTRQLTVFGWSFELRLLPGRAQRTGRPVVDRSAFRGCPGARIIATEALWSNADLVVTGNRYPFAPAHLLLWPREPVREPPLELLAVGFAAGERCGATVLWNSIGAAASIPHAHLHLVRDRQPLHSGLRWRSLAQHQDQELLALEAPGEWPCQVIGLRAANATALASATHRMLARRLTPAINLVCADRLCMLVPRRLEAARDHFPAAVGSAEWAGIFVYDDPAAFAVATADHLAAALTACGWPRRDRENDAAIAAFLP